MVDDDDHGRRGNDSSQREERFARVRDMLAADLARGRIHAKRRYVLVLVEEFKISKRVGYQDVADVWEELRSSHDAEVRKASVRVLAKLEDYVDELWDLYQECRDEGDRGTARGVLADLAKARDLLGPDRVDVTVRSGFDVTKLPLDEQRALLEGIRKARVDEPS